MFIRGLIFSLGSLLSDIEEEEEKRERENIERTSAKD
jgi:hypothetical protein